MLVSGLENCSLCKIACYYRPVNYLHVYDALCQCAMEMLAKYEKNQVRGEKLNIKTRAVKILLGELGNIPENQRDTRAAIASALNRHEEALQGYEHLLSKKGNSYMLMRQTQCVRYHNREIASLLHYHVLKNKLLGPHLPLTTEQKEAISELAEKKGLTMKMVKAIESEAESEVYPRITLIILVRLHRAGLLDPNLCAKVFEHDNPYSIINALVILDKTDMFKPYFYAEVSRHNSPVMAEIALDILAGLFKPDLVARVLEHQEPFITATALVKLHKANMLGHDLCAEVLKYRNSDSTDNVLVKLYKLNLLGPDLCVRVLKHKNPDSAGNALVKLHQANLLKLDLCAEVLQYENPDDVARELGELRTRAEEFAMNASSEMDKPELLYGLLVTIMASNIKDFCVAMENGHDGIITAFIKKCELIIAALTVLKDEQKTELVHRLLACKNVDGTPVFFMTLQKGCSHAARALISPCNQLRGDTSLIINHR